MYFLGYVINRYVSRPFWFKSYWLIAKPASQMATNGLFMYPINRLTYVVVVSYYALFWWLECENCSFYLINFVFRRTAVWIGLPTASKLNNLQRTLFGVLCNTSWNTLSEVLFYILKEYRILAKIVVKQNNCPFVFIPPWNFTKVLYSKTIFKNKINRYYKKWAKDSKSHIIRRKIHIYQKTSVHTKVHLWPL
jgi:hypothetical protein